MRGMAVKKKTKKKKNPEEQELIKKLDCVSLENNRVVAIPTFLMCFIPRGQNWLQGDNERGKKDKRRVAKRRWMDCK